MDKLEITLDSREVAAMVDKEHSKLLRDIRTYIEHVNKINQKAFEEGRGAESKIGLGDFFRESYYLDANNQSRLCYQITKKGCEFISHKLTGIKGTEFTMRYINRFYEMEKALTGAMNVASKLKNATLPEITGFLHETSSFLREMDKVMRDQNSHPSDIAEEFKNVCEQFGIVELSDNFVKEPTMQEPTYYDERYRFYTMEELGLGSRD